MNFYMVFSHIFFFNKFKGKKKKTFGDFIEQIH